MDYQFDQSKEDIKNKNIYKINCSITDKRIQEKLNHIHRNEILSFGDGENDLEMLSMFPYSCAMENGCLLAQTKASRIIGSNKDYAVCKEMLKIIE